MADTGYNLVQIRPATATDIPFLIELDRASSSAAHWTEQQYAQLFGTPENAPERLVLVVDASDQKSDEPHPSQPVLGFLVARHVVTEWELENIVVASHTRRRGLGKLLLQAFLDHAKRARSASVFLEVRESNAAARALYADAGFRQTGRRKSYYANPSEDAILYRSDLA